MIVNDANVSCSHGEYYSCQDCGCPSPTWVPNVLGRLPRGLFVGTGWRTMQSDVTPLAVFPTKFEAGVDDIDSRGRPFRDNGGALVGAPLRGAEAWTREYDTDAHCVAYAVPGAPLHLRVNKSALPAFVREGAGPLLYWAIVDVDNPGHARWTNPSVATISGIQAQVRDAGLDGAGVYLTRSGYRLVWRLATPVPVGTRAEAGLSRLLDHLERVGLSPDRHCADWTHLYRMPRVVRDGERAALPMDLGPCLP